MNMSDAARRKRVDCGASEWGTRGEKSGGEERAGGREGKEKWRMSEDVRVEGECCIGGENKGEERKTEGKIEGMGKR